MQVTFQTTCINGCKSKLLFKSPATVKPTATCSLPLWGRVGERVFFQIAAIFPNTLTAQIQALRLVALSLALSHGREDGAAVGVKGYARKTGCADCFLFFRRPASTVVNPSCFSNRLKPQNLLQPAPSPVGEGWGEGIPQIATIFPNTLTAQNTSLAACCPLSNSLPRGERMGRLLGVKGSARKTNCAGCFLFFRRPEINGVNPSCFSNCL